MDLAYTDTTSSGALRGGWIQRCCLSALLLFVTCAWVVSASAASDKFYTVRRGDTLYGIAKKHGIALDRLAARNGLDKNAFIYPGQRLAIPAKGSTGQRIEPLPSSVQKAIQDAKVRAGRWKYLVIHHSAVDTGTIKGMDQYHRNVRHMENGLAYHFVIGNGNGMADGEVVATHRWTRQLDGGHLLSQRQNQYCIGICLVGNFDKDKPSLKQMQRLTALVQALQTRCKLGVDAVKTHQEINVVGTRCPGRHFPTKTFRASLGAR